MHTTFQSDTHSLLSSVSLFLNCTYLTPHTTAMHELPIYNKTNEPKLHILTTVTMKLVAYLALIFVSVCKFSNISCSLICYTLILNSSYLSLHYTYNVHDMKYYVSSSNSHTQCGKFFFLSDSSISLNFDLCWKVVDKMCTGTDMQNYTFKESRNGWCVINVLLLFLFIIYLLWIYCFLKASNWYVLV